MRICVSNKPHELGINSSFTIRDVVSFPTDCIHGVLSAVGNTHRYVILKVNVMTNQRRKFSLIQKAPLKACQGRSHNDDRYCYHGCSVQDLTFGKLAFPLISQCLGETCVNAVAGFATPNYMHLATESENT